METQGSYWRYCATPHWEPSINVFEGLDAYHICADLAGTRQEHIDVQVQGEHLIIRGQRAVPRPDLPGDHISMHHMEIEHGPFCREMDLPADVDTNAITARYKDGLLWVKLSKLTGEQHHD